jgi:REP element-mobilizing transposase RayT
MIRGINRQAIFEDDEDRIRFIDTLREYKDISKYEIYGYCLMDNHIHLLIKEIDESISLIIKRISSSYVHWYNTKYERLGHLFQERFRSEVVEDDGYFLTVLRYIHQNPVKAKIAENVGQAEVPVPMVPVPMVPPHGSTHGSMWFPPWFPCTHI